MITMEAIDYVINVTGASYKNVRVALLDADGDVDIAIKLLKERKQDSEYLNFTKSETKNDWKDKTNEAWQSVTNSIDDIIDGIREIVKKGNARRLIVEKNGNIVLSLSLNVSVVGAILAPLAALVGVGAAVVSDYDFKIIMEDESVINVKEYIRNKKEPEKEDEQEILDEDEE